MRTRIAIWLAIVLLSVLAGFSAHPLLRAALPALIPALIATLFARSLRRDSTPLIARAIAALDGPQWLADPAIARYARRLTAIWALALAALASAVVALAVRASFAAAFWPWLPSATRFGAIGVPLAVLALLLGEFVLRPHWLPQAPRKKVFEFLHGLVVAWPTLLTERSATPANDTCEHFHIAAAHPALPGHFPGDPIVPGVVLLERAASLAERTWKLRVTGLSQAKFLRALRPDEHARLSLQREGTRVQWRIARGDDAIAQGVLELGA